MRLRLVPRDASYGDLFTSTARHLVTGADLLAQLVAAEPSDRAQLATALRDTRRAADAGGETILRRLTQTLVTPLDREDIHALAVALLDCLRHLEAVADLSVLHAIEEFPAGVSEQIEVLHRAAELIVRATGSLSSHARLLECSMEIARLGRRAARIHRVTLAELTGERRFSREPAGVIDLLRHRDVVDALGRASESFAQLADITGLLVVKES